MHSLGICFFWMGFITDVVNPPLCILNSFSPRLAHSLGNLYNDNNFSEDETSTPPSSFVPSPSPALTQCPTALPSSFSFGYTTADPRLPPSHVNFNQEANANLNSLTASSTVSASRTVRPMNRGGYSRPSPRRGPFRAGLSGFPGCYLSRSIPVSDRLTDCVRLRRLFGP